MFKKFSRLAAMLLTVAMVTTIGLTGCGDKKESTDSTTSAVSSSAQSSTVADPTLAPAKIKWLLRIAPQKDSDTVLAELNKTFQEKINATLEIQFIEAASYAEKTKLIIAAAEEFDMMFTSVGYSFYENVAKNAYIPMDGILQEYAPKAYAQIPASFWDAVKVNGKIYGFPNYQIAARQSSIAVRKDMVEKYGIKVDEIKSYEQYEPYLEKMKAGEPADKFLMTRMGLKGMDNTNYLGFEILGPDETPGAVEINGTDFKVFNQYEYPKMVSYAKLIRSWQEKGYINQDLSLVKEGGAFEELSKNGKIVSMPNNWKPGAEAEMVNRYGFEPSYIKLIDPYVSTASITGTLQAISRTSKNPERALMMLEMINTDKKIYNTLLFGIEDKHYKKTGENNVEVIKDSGYSPNVAWMLGNQLNAYLLPGVASNIPQMTDDMNKNSKYSRIMGFSFNSEPVKSEIAQCLTVTKKYLDGFEFGMYDVDSTLAKMNAELKAAGMEKVIAEKQKQLDEWVAISKK